MNSSGSTSEPAPGRRLSRQERDQLADDLTQRYRAGASLHQLALDTGYSFGFIRRLLLDHGVELRPRGGPHHHS